MSIALGGCVFLKNPTNLAMNTIADGDFGAALICCCKLREGKDHPQQLGKKKWDEKGATVGLILRMMEPIHQMGKIVTHDYCFCVTAGILALHNFGVYGQALIKKKGRYWPHNVPGDLSISMFMRRTLD